MGREERKVAVGLLVVIGLLGYVGISHLAFAFRHPELTDTDRALRLLDALRWR